jgi:hypothetical protein
MNAYLDIETTGLNPFTAELTVIGVGVEGNQEWQITQLVGDEISPTNLIRLVEKVEVLYTYNGENFDLPFIKAKLNLNLTEYCQHYDLMHECHQRNLYGGVKAVERQLGISRKMPEINGQMAVILWQKYKFNYDREALETLLAYNREDVLNLKKIKERLELNEI